MMALRVGLTGGIGCGKSTVAGIFAELHVPVIDADDIARDSVQPGKPAFDAIIRMFGDQIVIDGELDRAALRQRIFADPERRRALENLLHPLVYRDMDARARVLGSPYCILSVPLLLETAPPHFVDRVLVVDCSVRNQIRRTRSRDRISEAEIRRIIDTQISRRERLQAADDVIDNDDGPALLRPRVESLHGRYLELARTRASGSALADSGDSKIRS